MIRHIVMWTLLEQAHGADKAHNVQKAKDLLLSCAQVVPGIRTFEVATAETGLECDCDLLLHMLVDDAQVLAAYQNHPDHEAIKPFMKAIRKTRHCMDFIVH